MKTKTIKSILKKKFNDFLGHIEDENVRSLVENNTIITGGSIVSLLLNENPNDYDLYFRDKKTTKAVAEYFVDKWNKSHGPIKNKIGNDELVFVLDGQDVEDWKSGKKSLIQIAPNHKFNVNWSDMKNNPNQLAVSHMITNTEKDRIKIIFPSDGIVSDKEQQDALDDLSEIESDLLEQTGVEQDKEKYRPVFITTNAISLSDKIQLIIRFYGDPEEIHKNYDFEHCKCYWDSKSEKLITPEKSLLCILNKDLQYTGSKYPICSVIRSRKFINHGWEINAGQYLKMCMQISELDLTNLDVLEDQLFGVDTIYFMQIVGALREMKKKNPNFSFNSNYISTIIDKVF